MDTESKIVANLLPELREWNDGTGISPLDWLLKEARPDMAVAFASLFWPTFVEFEGYVLREGFAIEALRGLEARNVDRKGIETTLNLLDLLDLCAPADGELNDLAYERAIHVGQVLAETWQAKLARDIPNRVFFVKFRDGADTEDEDEINVTFWRVSA